MLTHHVAKALAEDRITVGEVSRHKRHAEERQVQLRAQRRAARRTSRANAVRSAWNGATGLFTKAAPTETYTIVELPESETIRSSSASVKETANRR